MSRILKSRQAYGDLEEIADYIAADSPRHALQFLQAAERAFARLSSMPKLGRVWSRTRKRFAGVRVWSVPDFRHFLIFYRPIDGGIEILRVLHGARNLTELLGEDD